MNTFRYSRLIVVGVTSSGKSTLAEKLAEKLSLDFVELDALYWQPEWQGTPVDEFVAKVEEATAGERWVIAGNYSRTREATWPYAQVVIWLDYPLWTVFWRLTRRTVRRAITQEVLWGTNIDPFWQHLKFWSQDSLFHWLFKTYWRRRDEYPYLFSLPEYQHLVVYHFTDPKETEQWFAQLG